MYLLDPATIFWIVMAAQLVGWASLVAFRLSLSLPSGSSWLWHSAFYSSLAMVGMVTLFAVTHEASCWVCPAASLGGMTIGGIIE